MKKLLTIVVIATLSIGLGAISLAQDAGPQGGQLEGKNQKGRARGAMMTRAKIEKEVLDSLGLTDIQNKKIADMRKEVAEKLKALKKSDKGTPGNEKDRAEMKKIRNDYEKELQSVLGPDNWKKYREGMLAKMKEAREKHKAKQDKP